MHAKGKEVTEGNHGFPSVESPASRAKEVTEGNHGFPSVLFTGELERSERNLGFSPFVIKEAKLPVTTPRGEALPLALVTRAKLRAGRLRESGSSR
jgi:hypothetical protein